MTLNKMLIPVSALAIFLGAGQFSAEAAQRGDRRDRGGRDNQGQAQQRSGDARDRGTASRDRGSANNDQRGSANNQQRGNARGSQGDRREQRNDNVRPSDRRGGYSAPRVVPPRVLRPSYGSRGNLSVYFGWGSGYRYGSPYSGRVYGYAAPVYGSRIYYGDVRLQVRPRDAAVFVDGYYAGIVDDFDGVFQRLTLAVGPHQIEIEAPGLEPQVFNVYVDPTRTVDLRSDLFPERP